MIKFEETMDPHSRQIRRDGIIIGDILWGPDQTPRIANLTVNTLTLEELKTITTELGVQSYRFHTEPALRALRIERPDLNQT